MVKILNTLGLILAVAIIGSQASVIENKKAERLDVRILSHEQMKEFLKHNPESVELLKIVKPQVNKDTEGPAPHVIIEYTLGSRVIGDWLVAHDAQSHTYSSPRDIQMTIQYPASGVGNVVSHVSILVSQSSSSGRAYVTSGGVGYRYVTVVVEADHTYYFDHDANIYGY